MKFWLSHIDDPAGGGSLPHVAAISGEVKERFLGRIQHAISAAIGQYSPATGAWGSSRDVGGLLASRGSTQLAFAADSIRSLSGIVFCNRYDGRLASAVIHQVPVGSGSIWNREFGDWSMASTTIRAPSGVLPLEAACVLKAAACAELVGRARGGGRRGRRRCEQLVATRTVRRARWLPGNKPLMSPARKAFNATFSGVL
jgi:hypothetical protein